MSLFYFPPDGQALEPCAWSICRNPQAKSQRLNLCDMHARFAYRILDEDRRSMTTETPEEYTAEVEQFAVAALALGWIYYLAVGERIKVGYTADIKQRLRNYPPESELLALRQGTMAQEKVIHSLLTAHRVAGREWYGRDPEVLEHIAGVVAEHGMPAIKRHEWTKPERQRTTQTIGKSGRGYKIA